MALRLLVCLIFVSSLVGAAPAHPNVPAAALPSAHFDATAATHAWLDTVPPSAHARSDAYFEGGYWLTLWDFLYGTAVLIFLLITNMSASMRDLAERVTRTAFLRDLIYWTEFSVVYAVLAFPLTVYESFFREKRYGLLNQNFAGWFRDQLIMLALTVVLGGIAVAVFVMLVRRLPRTWHIWSTVVGVAFTAIGALITPIFLMPLFNTYTPLPDGPLKTRILSLAHSNGIPVNNVYTENASRQSDRVSANVSGLFGTDRITLNDNLLNRVSPEGVMSTMGHEMGHYVMHHIYNSILFAAIGIFVSFAILRWGLNWCFRRYGARWAVRDNADIALLPAALLIVSILGFVSTPIANTFTRTQEYEADIFGINSARQPDGEAEVDVLLGEYRKLDPSPLEEFIFYDHPSGRKRIYAAMRWKAENLCLFDPALPCGATSITGGGESEGKGHRL
jgi:STE24 endopeptidase